MIDPSAPQVMIALRPGHRYKAVDDGFEGANVDGCVWAYTNTMYFRDPASNAWIGQLLSAIGL